ncbi:MAG TPA: beta-ketoacyl synthase chain length factor [Magnetospirillum sp.]|nr:beta-ketoacyl synthase chain length factor [Magnetospirillum sp.]
MQDIPQEDLHALHINVLAWAAYCEGDETVATGNAIQPAPPLPAALRRRITPIGRKALEAAWAVLAGRPGMEPRIILSSRHGEYDRTLGLLDSLADSGEVSPAEFSLAVHHGLAGLLSIATGNRQGHTAVSAGVDSFAAALTEAAACLTEGDASVLVMHFDSALPRDYEQVGGGTEPGLALALLLTPAGGESIVMRQRPTAKPGEECAAAALINLLRSNADEARAAGGRMVWSFSRAA